MFPQILYDIDIDRRFLPVKFFPRVLLLEAMFRATAKCNLGR